jgi:hypothetical protein
MFGLAAAEDKTNRSLSPKIKIAIFSAPIFTIGKSAAGENPKINFLPLEGGGLRWG